MTTSTTPGLNVDDRARELFDEVRRRGYIETDRMFAVLMVVQWLFGLLMALTIAPRAWSGPDLQSHSFVWTLVVLGGPIAAIPIVLALVWPGRTLTRHVIAVAQMLFSGLLIHLTGGRIETHFHIFGSLAFLAAYRDWSVLVPATIVVALDHLVRGIYWPQSVYGILIGGSWRWLEHTGWVVFEGLALAAVCRRGEREMREMAEQRAALETSKTTVERANDAIRRKTADLRVYGERLRLALGEAETAGRAKGEVLQEMEAINRDLNSLNDIQESLFRCFTVDEVCRVATDALVQRFNAYFARVWLRRPGDLCQSCALRSQCPDRKECLHLIASSGYFTGLDGLHRRVPLGAYKIGLIAQGKARIVINDVLNDRGIQDRKWAADNELKSFAGLPLVRSGEVIGVMAMFSQQEIPSHFLDTLDVLAKLLTAALGNVQQFSQLKQATSAAEDASLAAEQASRAKGEFLANMSHEIRSPLNAIIGFGELLRSGALPDPAEQKRCYETICHSGHHLLGLINDILDLTKIDAGRIELDPVACAPGMLITEVVSILKPRAEEKGVSLEVSGEVPRTITTDPTRFRQLLMNLVGNAIKFTERGSVSVSVRSLAGDGAHRLRIEVTDTGIGIPANKMESIFEPFVQADSSTTRQFGGTGLGLTISRRIARALGGDLTVTSEVGRGSVFCLDIRVGLAEGDDGQPVSLDQASIEVSEPADGAAPDLSGRHILVVDDGDTNARLITTVLRRAGATTATAENGRQALTQAAREKFDLVLMDMQMPIMDGYTAARQLRHRGMPFPIIALTANALRGDEEKCRAAGCSGYLTKPVLPQRLLKAVAEALGVPVQKGDGEEREASPPKRPAAGMRSALPMDDPEFREVVLEFVDRLQQQIQRLVQARDEGDLRTIAMMGHWLKGAGGTAGFHAFTEPAGRLEMFAKESRVEEAAAEIEHLARLARTIEIPGAPAMPLEAAASGPTSERRNS